MGSNIANLGLVLGVTVILGSIKSLKEDKTVTQQSAKVLDAAERNSQRLYGLINQLLDITKLESGKMPLKVREENVISLLKSHFQSFESLVLLQNIELHFESNMESYVGFIDKNAVAKMQQLKMQQL